MIILCALKHAKNINSHLIWQCFGEMIIMSMSELNMKYIFFETSILEMEGQAIFKAVQATEQQDVNIQPTDSMLKVDNFFGSPSPGSTLCAVNTDILVATAVAKCKMLRSHHLCVGCLQLEAGNLFVLSRQVRLRKQLKRNICHR